LVLKPTRALVRAVDVLLSNALATGPCGEIRMDRAASWLRTCRRIHLVDAEHGHILPFHMCDYRPLFLYRT
jgi:hypothetical protein